MSKPAQLSGSGFGRGVACSAAYALPHTDSTSEAAERGTALHHYIALVLDGWIPSEVLALIPEQYRAECAAIDLIQPRKWAATEEEAMGLVEIALVYDTATDTTRELPKSNAARDYGDVSATEIPMTLDLVVQRGHAASVYDWKTGTYCDPAQLRIAALAVARWLDVQSVEVAFGFLQRDGSWRLGSEQSFDTMDLDIIADEARIAVANIARDREVVAAGLLPVVSPGDHCGFCGAKSACPEFTTATTALVPLMPRKLAPSDIETATDEECALYWQQFERAARILDEYKAALDARARRAPFALSNGDVVQEVSGERASIDAAVALDVLTERATPEEIAKAITVSQEGLKRALGKRAPGIIACIEAQGGILKKATTPTVKACSPKMLTRKGRAA